MNRYNHNITPEEFEEILQKPVLSHHDLDRFNSYRNESEELLDFATLKEVYKRVIQNNDIDGWELLSEYEYYTGFQPPFDLCLELATRYGNYETFAHILNAYSTYSKAEYGDPIPTGNLLALAHSNPNKRVQKVVDELVQMVPGNRLTEKFAEKHAEAIRYLLGYNEIKEPDMY